MKSRLSEIGDHGWARPAILPVRPCQPGALLGIACGKEATVHGRTQSRTGSCGWFMPGDAQAVRRPAFFCDV